MLFVKRLSWAYRYDSGRFKLVLQLCNFVSFNVDHYPSVRATLEDKVGKLPPLI